jgi:hypothetical protein
MFHLSRKKGIAIILVQYFISTINSYCYALPLIKYSTECTFYSRINMNHKTVKAHVRLCWRITARARTLMIVYKCHQRNEVKHEALALGKGYVLITKL